MNCRRAELYALKIAGLTGLCAAYSIHSTQCAMFSGCSGRALFHEASTVLESSANLSPGVAPGGVWIGKACCEKRCERSDTTFSGKAVWSTRLGKAVERPMPLKA